MALITFVQFTIVAAIVVYLTANMLHLVKLEPVRGPLSSSPSISVCVPARNEERGIRACLESLLKQDYPRFEAIAADDNSTDATPAIIESLAAGDPRLTLVRGEPLPEGWFGKPYALHQAYRKARGEYLLFTDADPVFQPFALTSAMYVMRKDNLDVLTLMPGTEFGSFWERAVQPVIFGFIAALTRFRKANDRDYPDAMGIGAFMLFRRDAYERLGGHERVRQEIVEDIALAKCAKREGLKLLIADGKRVYSIRMYHSLREIWLGWRKNMFVAMKQSVARTLYYIAAVLSFVAAPYLTFFANLALDRGFFWTAVSFAALALSWIAGVKLCEELGLEKRNVFLFPLGAVVMSAIMLDSMGHILLKGGIEWRGRQCAAPGE